MAIYFDKSKDLKLYSKAYVFLKSEKNPWGEVTGGNLEVDTNDETITVKTSKEFALFNQNDVLAIRLV